MRPKGRDPRATLSGSARAGARLAATVVVVTPIRQPLSIDTAIPHFYGHFLDTFFRRIEINFSDPSNLFTLD
jgi:hypothetical protein